MEMPWRRGVNVTGENAGDHGQVEWWGEDAEWQFRVQVPRRPPPARRVNMAVAAKGGPGGGARRRPEGRGESAQARGVVGGPPAIFEGSPLTARRQRWA